MMGLKLNHISKRSPRGLDMNITKDFEMEGTLNM